MRPTLLSLVLGAIAVAAGVGPARAAAAPPPAAPVAASAPPPAFSPPPSAFDAGIDDYVTKPVSLRILLARIRAGQRIIILQQEVQKEKQDIQRYSAELSAANRRLEMMAYTDVLTDLPNRRYALSRLEQEWSALITPATKAEIGDHDINIDFEEALKISPQAGELRDLTLKLYGAAADYAKERGIILADNKFEFGTDASGKIILGDEALTPDSSRFWEAESWVPGGAQASFDKQYLRDYLTSSGWDRESAPPELPQDIVEKTAQRYRDAYLRLTGTQFN